MAGPKASTKIAADSANQQAQASTIEDRDKLTDKQLAKAVVAGEIRPRAAEVRRLAEAVLKKGTPKAAKKKRKTQRAKSGKLVKIPRQKKK